MVCHNHLVTPLTIQLQMIQRKAAKFVFSNYSKYSSVSAMLIEFDWRTLEKRRDNSILVMLHKIINQYVDIPHNHILHTDPGVAAAVNSYTCHQGLKHSFFPSCNRIMHGITCQITLLKLMMLILLNHYCSYILTLLVFSLLTNHVHYARD